MEINEAAKRCHYSWLSVSSHVSRVTKWSHLSSPQGKWGQMAVQIPARPSCQLPLFGSGECMDVPQMSGKATSPVEVKQLLGSVLRRGHLSFSSAEPIKVLSWSTGKSSFPTFQFCSESHTCVLLRSRALGHCINRGGTQCALAPSQHFVFHFHPSSGWQQEFCLAEEPTCDVASSKCLQVVEDKGKLKRYP